MVSLQGSIICPDVRARQVGIHSLPVNIPLINFRFFRSELWGIKGVNGSATKVGALHPQLKVRRCMKVQCTFSSSSNGNGSMAENFNEHDEEYVNSSVVEAGTSSHLCPERSLSSCFNSSNPSFNSSNPCFNSSNPFSVLAGILS